MTDERVEPTKEWLDALIENLEDACGDCEPYNDGGDKPYVESCDKHKAMWELRDAILASQPERVECAQPKFHEFVARHKGKLGPIAECPYCGGDAQ